MFSLRLVFFYYKFPLTVPFYIVKVVKCFHKPRLVFNGFYSLVSVNFYSQYNLKSVFLVKMANLKKLSGLINKIP